MDPLRVHTTRLTARQYLQRDSLRHVIKALNELTAQVEQIDDRLAALEAGEGFPAGPGAGVPLDDVAAENATDGDPCGSDLRPSDRVLPDAEAGGAGVGAAAAAERPDNLADEPAAPPEAAEEPQAAPAPEEAPPAAAATLAGEPDYEGQEPSAHYRVEELPAEQKKSLVAAEAEPKAPGPQLSAAALALLEEAERHEQERVGSILRKNSETRRALKAILTAEAEAGKPTPGEKPPTAPPPTGPPPEEESSAPAPPRT